MTWKDIGMLPIEVFPIEERTFDTKLVAYKGDTPVFVTKPVVMDEDRIKVYFAQLDERLVSE